jgi:predicted O-methyltransferase YrrM
MADFLEIILALLALSGIYYLARILRRVNKKLKTIVSIEKDIRQNTKELEKSIRQSYRQGEAFAQLISLLNFESPLPPTRNWAASPDLLLTLHHYARRTSPQVILDLGSGLSTLILAKSAPTAKVISVDNSSEFAEKTAQILRDHKIDNVDLRVAPLSPHNSGVDWYQLAALSGISQINLLFIDGPPGSKNPAARHPAFDECLKLLAPDAIVIIDDVGRNGEKELAEKFAAALPQHRIEYLSHEKGTAVILPR